MAPSRSSTMSAGVPRPVTLTILSRANKQKSVVKVSTDPHPVVFNKMADLFQGLDEHLLLDCKRMRSCTWQ